MSTNRRASPRAKLPKQFRVLIATDGSDVAWAALSTALKFPLPENVSARAIAACSDWLGYSPDTYAAVKASFEEAAAAARKAMARHWPESTVVVVDASPGRAILAEAAQFKADVVVVGWRGHGTFRRLLAGSVSRHVTEHAQCSVLVVREAPSSVRRFVVGFDGSANAERAVDLICRLEPKRGCNLLVVNVVGKVMVSSLGILPAFVRVRLQGEIKRMNDERLQEGQAKVDGAVARLQASGWRAEGEVVSGGDPLAALTKSLHDFRGDVLVLGARATSGIERALLGSVANGALNSVPAVLLVH